HTYYVGVVVTASEFCRNRFGDGCGADTMDLVCRDGNANSCSADKYAELSIACNNSPADARCIVWIICGFWGVGSVICYLVAMLAKHISKAVLEVKSGVVGAYCELHSIPFLVWDYDTRFWGGWGREVAVEIVWVYGC